MHSVVFRMGEYHRLVASWWLQHHGNAVNEKLLARFGVAVLDESGPIAIVHLYPASTADLVWAGFTVVSPSISKFKAGKALKLLIEEAEEAVRRLGYSVLYTGYDAPALQKLCQKRGYHEGSAVIEQWKAVK